MSAVKTYRVKEIFYTLQGEGVNTGRPAVFCRFSGCNSWDGRPETRERSNCPFCDTDFLGIDGRNGGKYTAHGLAEKIAEIWGDIAVHSSQAVASDPTARRYQQLVVLTGGEPALQVDEELVKQLKTKGLKLAIETNGSIALPGGIDWITVSPKPNLLLKQLTGHELKLLYPVPGLEPENFLDSELQNNGSQTTGIQNTGIMNTDFENYLLSPLWDAQESVYKKNIELTLAYCLQFPLWRFTTQYHKIWGLD